MTRRLLIGLAGACVLACGAQRRGQSPPSTHIINISEATWPDIDALDRNRTLFLLTIGMLEEHGPHLPIAADTIGVEYEARGVAERLTQALPDWDVAVMPTVNYGSSGVNQMGSLAIHPGTYAVRQSTLRSLVADIGGRIAQNGFKWVFVLNGHGAPTHHSAVNEACDFISEEFKVTMLNVSGLFSADEAIQAQGERIKGTHFSPADVASFGQDPHAGVSETSGMLAVRPDLVRPGYKTLPDAPVHNRKEMRELASKAGWPGYFSSPAHANAAYGRDVEAWWMDGMTALILRAVRGENLFGRPRWPEPAASDPEYAQLVEHVLQPDRDFELKFERWRGQRR